MKFSVLILLVAAAFAQGAAGDLGFEVPPGYVQQRKDNIVILAPATTDPTSCIYGIAGKLPSSGNLETDVGAALVNAVVPGWRRLDDRFAAMRGTSAAGWPYVWYRAAFQGDMGGQVQSINAMAMVLPAGGGQNHLVFGMGSIARCLFDDATFEFLFHSLRPQGWTSDKGQALSRALTASWRFTAGSSGMNQIAFRSGGRYDRDLGSTARVGVSERTSSTATGGRFTLQNGELTLIPDNRPGDPDRYYVRVYDEFSSLEWKPSMVLFDSRAKPPAVIQYYRVDP